MAHARATAEASARRAPEFSILSMRIALEFVDATALDLDGEYGLRPAHSVLP